MWSSRQLTIDNWARASDLHVRGYKYQMYTCVPTSPFLKSFSILISWKQYCWKSQYSSIIMFYDENTQTFDCWMKRSKSICDKALTRLLCGWRVTELWAKAVQGNIGESTARTWQWWHTARQSMKQVYFSRICCKWQWQRSALAGRHGIPHTTCMYTTCGIPHTCGCSRQ